jgi:predicted Zn-dependent protease
MEKQMNLKTIVLGTVLSATSIGCSAERGIEYNIYISPSFSAEDQQAALDAIQLWQLALGKDLRVLSINIGNCEANNDPVLSDVRNLICIQPCSNQWIARETEEYAVGLTLMENQTNSANVMIPAVRDQGYNTAYMIRVIEHELGHAFGLSHTEKNTLMYWEVGSDSSPLPTCEDIQQYRNLRHQSDVIPNPSCPTETKVVFFH